MPKKKAPINGYSLFMKEKQRELGGRISMKEVAEMVKPLWDQLSNEERARYSDRAKIMKQTTGPVYGKMTSDGTPLALIEAAEQERENEIKQMQADVAELIYHLSPEALIEKKFYVISFNILVATSDDNFLPNEIGLIEYSLKEGITKSYHRFIEPDPIPTGFMSACKDHSEMTHKIPFLEFQLHDSNYEAIFDSILDFTCARRGPVMLFSHNEQLTQNRCCFNWLMQKASYDNDNFSVGDLTMLLAELRNRSNYPYAAKVLASDALNSNNFDFVSNTRCDYHEDLDNPYCALGFSRRLCFILSDQLLNLYEIELTPGHMPERNFECASMIWHPTGPLRPVVNIIDVPQKPIVERVPTTIIHQVRSVYAAQFDDSEDATTVLPSKMNAKSPPPILPPASLDYQPPTWVSGIPTSPCSSTSSRVSVASRLATNQAPNMLMGVKKPTSKTKLSGRNIGRGRSIFDD